MTFQPAKESINNDVIFESPDIKYVKAKDSAAMKQMRQNERLERAMRSGGDQEFYKVLQSESAKYRRVTKEALGKTIDYFKKGKGREINSGEAKIIEGEFRQVLGGRTYRYTESEKSNPGMERKNASPKNINPVVSPRGESSVMTKPKSSSGRGIAPRLGF